MNLFTRVVLSLLAVSGVISFAPAFARADHSWGDYHWARTANPFTLRLGDNVSFAWDSYLRSAATDWNASSVLDTSVVAGRATQRQCRPTSGRVEVCNYRYGNNGWLGIAQIWVNGSHIVQGAVKLNDTYFNTATYNKPAWRRLVMCQEIAHAFGLDHQDEMFGNANLGSCMDYTSDPDGTIRGELSNEHPNAHDFEQIEAIYAHTDSFTTVAAGTSVMPALASAIDPDNMKAWGIAQKYDKTGKPSLFRRDLGKGLEVYTFVTWAE